MTALFSLPPRFAGVRVVGDVHGYAEPFAEAIAGARGAGLFVVQLGDLIDRGPNSAEALRLAFDLLDCGDGLFVRGNHDDKLRRKLEGRSVQVGPMLQGTLDSLAATADPIAFRARTLHTLQAAPWWLSIGTYVFVHGAFDPLMRTAPSPDDLSAAQAERCRWLALYGEGKVMPGRDHPLRTHAWINKVPAGVSVVIGHDVVSQSEIVERTGTAGGRVLFLDTGMGKGGSLSWLDIGREALGA